MVFFTITFLQVDPEFEYQYLYRGEGMDFWNKFVKSHQILQSIRGVSKPKFFVSAVLWKSFDAVNAYLNSEERLEYNKKYVQFYGDLYTYDVISNHRVVNEHTQTDKFGSMIRYLVKPQYQDKFVKEHEKFFENYDLIKAGIEQTVFLQSPSNKSQVANLTIWKSENLANSWQAPEEMQDWDSKYLEHETDRFSFDIASIITTS